MEVAYLIYLALIGFSTFVIVSKSTESIIYLPVIFIIYEILKNIFFEFGIEYGVNGFQNLNIFLFILPHLGRLLNKISTLTLLIFIFLVYYYFRIPYSEDLVSLATQSLGLFNIYSLFLIGYTYNLNKNEWIFHQLNRSYLHLLIIYCVYIIFASILSFGPNHYDTGVIYGLRFEQYYTAALVIILFPVMREFLSKSDSNKYMIFSVIGILIILLTLRRTSYVILMLGFLLYPFFTDLKTFRKWVLKFSPVIIAVVVLGAILYIYTDIYTYRDTEYSLDYNIEHEGRFMEFNLVLYTLDVQDSYMFGIGKFLNEEGYYNFFSSERPLHGTMAKLLLGGGVVGLSLFYLIFLNMIMRLRKYVINRSFVKYKAMGITLVVIYLAVSMTGAIGVGTGVSFTGSLFLYLGFLMNILKYTYFGEMNSENRIQQL